MRLWRMIWAAAVKPWTPPDRMAWYTALTSERTTPARGEVVHETAHVARTHDRVQFAGLAWRYLLLHLLELLDPGLGPARIDCTRLAVSMTGNSRCLWAFNVGTDDDHQAQPHRR